MLALLYVTGVMREPLYLMGNVRKRINSTRRLLERFPKALYTETIH